MAPVIYIINRSVRMCENKFSYIPPSLIIMKNWSTDTKKLKKNKEKFAIWKLEQLINFGLGKNKIKKSQLKKYWNHITIDAAKRKFFSLFVK